jgi:hypothetical protein
MESRAQGKGERGQAAKPEGTPSPVKGAQPIRDKNGKITGWSLPTPDGKRVKKGLDWGRQNGLDPAKFRAATQGAIAGAAVGSAAGFTAATVEEILIGIAVAF